MTYKHYMEQPMPLLERRIKRMLNRTNELMENLDDIDLTLHMGA